MEKCIEVWKPIKESPYHQVSNFGVVRSIDRWVVHKDGSRHFYEGKIMKSYGKDGDYNRIMLCTDGVEKTCYVHRLQMEAFVPNPDNLPCVNHKDCNKQHNFIWVNEDGTVDLEKSNLEWCTYVYNNNYNNRVSISAEKQLNRNDCSKPVLLLTKHMILLRRWPSACESERQTGIRQGTISRWCRANKQLCDLVWKYENAS